MSTNPFFESSYNASQYDQELYESLVIECIQVHGRDYYYLPRTLVNYDDLFGEDAAGSLFKDAAKVEMYLESTQGWEGEGEIISQFGIELRHEASLVMAKSRFKEEIGKRFNLAVPREGDLIVFPQEVDNRKRIFEISFVEPEAVFYQIGKLYVYRIKVRVFDYSGEQFDTGVEHIDDYETIHNMTQSVKLVNYTGEFNIGDIVTQKKGFKAVVLGFNEEESILILSSNEAENAADANPNPLWPLMSDSGAWAYMEGMEDTAESIGNADNKLIDYNEPIVVSTDEHNPYLN